MCWNCRDRTVGDGGGDCRPLRSAQLSRLAGLRRVRTVAVKSSFVGVFTLLVLYHTEISTSPSSSRQDRRRPAESSRGLSVASSPAATSIASTRAANEGASANLTARQAARQRRVAEVCAAEDSLRHNARPWQYKVDHRHRILYCPIPKAGWSSWKRVLFYLNGVIPSTETEVGITSDQKAGIFDMSAAGIQYLQSISMMSQHFFTFVFVRNPWERLVSAYINKAVDWNYTRIMHQPCSWETDTPYKEPITFTQFLECIADRDTDSAIMDMHWTPMWRLCDFCQIRYDYIGHLETVEEDAKDVIEKRNLKVAFPRTFYSRAFRTQDVKTEWYKAVPCGVLERLRKLYTLDFHLHGYSDIPPGWEHTDCTSAQ